MLCLPFPIASALLGPGFKRKIVRLAISYCKWLLVFSWNLFIFAV